MTTPDVIALAYRETGKIAVREYPMRMALNAGVAVLVALFGYPLFAIIWWLAVGAAAGLRFLAYRAYFRHPRASLPRSAALGFAAMNVLNSAVFLAPAWIVVELDTTAGYYGAACLFAGALIHVTVHNASTFLIFASTAAAIVLAFLGMSALISYRNQDILPLLTAGVFMWALVASYLGRRKNMRMLNEMTAAALKERAAAQQASEAKSAFLAKMSHEFRTPLNGVLGMAQALRAAPLTATQQEQIDTIIRSGDTLLELLNDVLDYSQIESGSLSLQPEEANLADVVRRSLALYEDPAARKGVALVSDLEGVESLRIMIDARRLSQCLANLISNGVKFTDSGAVLVKARASRNGSAPDMADIEIAVKDTGVGMKPEDSARIFDAFEQVDNSITRRHGGAGLGLAVSRGIVDAMGGSLTVESSPGAGATFVLRFSAPIAGVSDKDASPPRRSSVPETAARAAAQISGAVEPQASNRSAQSEPDGFSPACACFSWRTTSSTGRSWARCSVR